MKIDPTRQYATVLPDGEHLHIFAPAEFAHCEKLIAAEAFLGQFTKAHRAQRGEPTA